MIFMSENLARFDMLGVDGASCYIPQTSGERYNLQRLEDVGIMSAVNDFLSDLMERPSGLPKEVVSYFEDGFSKHILILDGVSTSLGLNDSGQVLIDGQILPKDKNIRDYLQQKF